MESAANLHHQHQLQDQLAAASSSSSSLTIPSYFGLGSGHVWTPNIALNSCNYINPRAFMNGVSSNLVRDSGQEISTNNQLAVNSPLNNAMVQDLGFHWNDGLNSGSNYNFFSQILHDESKIKDEMSAESFPKFTEILMHSPSRTNTEDFNFASTNHVKNNNIGNDHEHEQEREQEQEQDDNLRDLSNKLLIKTLISSGGQINGSYHMKGGEFFKTGFFSSRNRGNFSQIYPSINVSNWNVSNPPSSFSNSSLDLNLQTPADMLASVRSDVGNFNHSQDNNFDMFKESLSYSHHDQMLQQQQQPPSTLSCVPNKMTSFSSSEVTEAKRPSNSMEPMVINQTHPPKKTRLESRASCPPFKVRKEKLGDRIAALQQLVAPFGKTDTASVLMEAIGYIKFLQNQVETLSVPYMKPSCNKTNKQMHRNSMEGTNEEPTRDLRSRGLCLVPLGCLSYVTGDGGGGIWPPPGFNGGSS